MSPTQGSLLQLNLMSQIGDLFAQAPSVVQNDCQNFWSLSSGSLKPFLIVGIVNPPSWCDPGQGQQMGPQVWIFAFFLHCKKSTQCRLPL